MLLSSVSVAFAAAKFVPVGLKEITKTTTVYATEVKEEMSKYSSTETAAKTSWMCAPSCDLEEKPYTNQKGDKNGNPNNINDVIPENEKASMMKIKTTPDFTSSSKRQVNLHVKGITGVIGHGYTGNAGRGMAISCTPFKSDLSTIDAAKVDFKRSDSGSYIVQVTGLNPETEYIVSIYASESDNHFYCAELVRNINDNPAPIEWSANEVKYKIRDNISTITLPTLKNEEQLPLTYASSNSEIATIDANGNVTLKNTVEGSTTISATYSGDKYNETSAEYIITVESNEKDAYKWAEFDKPVTFTFKGQWNATTSNVAAGTSLIKDDNIEVKTHYDATAKKDYKGTFFGQKFDSSLQLGRVSAAPSTSNLQGTENSGSSPIIVTPKVDLRLVIIYRKQGVPVGDPVITDDEAANVITNTYSVGSYSNDGKGLYAANQKDITKKLDQTVIVGGPYDSSVKTPANANDYVYVAAIWTLEANETYTIWATGTTPTVFGIGYFIPETPKSPSVQVNNVAFAESEIALDGENKTVKIIAENDAHNVYYHFAASEATPEATELAPDTIEHDGLTFKPVPAEGVLLCQAGTLSYFTHDPIADLKSNVETISVTGVGDTSGIDGFATDANAPVEYYNLQGVRVANPENGIFIRRQGKTVSKVVVR